MKTISSTGINLKIVADLWDKKIRTPNINGNNLDDLCYSFGWIKWNNDNPHFKRLDSFFEYLQEQNKLIQFYAQLILVQ